MKRVILMFALFIGFICKAQRIDRSNPCKGDTITIDPVDKFRYAEPYQAVRCHKVSNMGIRLDLGFSYFMYNASTKNWIGNHGGMSFGLAIPFLNWSIGARAKTWTVSPGIDMATNGDTIPQSIKLNPNKVEYYIAYSFDFKQLSIEPYIGYMKSKYYLHQDDYKPKTYSIPVIRGVVFGVGLNKYFRGKSENGFTVVFMNLAYTAADYSVVNPNLGFGHFETTIGVGLKAFGRRTYYKVVKAQKVRQL